MNKIIVILLFLTFNFATSQQSTEKNNLPNVKTQKIDNIKSNYIEYFESLESENTYKDKPYKGIGYKPFKRWEYFWSTRVDNEGNFPKRDDVIKAHTEFKKSFLDNKENQLQTGEEWSELGPYQKPTPVRSNPGLGRINAIDINPNKPNEIWVGAATGGIWRTTNGGVNWNTFNIMNVLSLGVTDIEIAESNAAKVYVATGDANGTGSSSGFGAFSTGILKTTNSGQDWETVNFSPVFNEIEQSSRFLVYELEVSHVNSNKIYAATNNGIFLSSNGGNNWERIATGNARDIKLKPNDDEVLYAAFNNGGTRFQLYTYRNGTWEEKDEITNCRRVELSVNKEFPNLVYSLATDGRGGFRAVYKSLNSGNTWTEVSSNLDHPNYLHWSYNGLDQNGNKALGGQGWYDLAIALSPNSPDRFLIGGINIWKSNNSGNTYELKTFSQSFGNVDEIHVDQHILTYGPDGSLYVGNDGGIYKSTDEGENWTDISNGLNITQLYKFDQVQLPNDLVISGAQDNGTNIRFDNEWFGVLGGDGFDCAVHPTNPNIIYGSNFNQSSGVFWKSENGGNSWSFILSPSSQGINENAGWVAPITMDKNNPSNIYVGYQSLWRSTTGGSNWSRVNVFGSIIREISIAPSNSNTIYVVYGNKVEVSYNGGNSFKELFNAPAQVSYVSVNPEDDRDIIVTLGGYAAGQKVYRITNESAENISNGLPNFSANCSVFQKNSNGRIYVGTDIGVFTKDNVSDWSYFNEGMPELIISELKIQYPTGKLRASTYARGVWEIPVNDCNLNKPELSTTLEANENNIITVCKGEVVELSFTASNYDSFEWSNGETSNSILVEDEGVYYVEIFTNDGCVAISDKFEVAFVDYQDIKILDGNNEEVTNVELCSNDSLKLSYFGFFKDVEWSNGETSRTIWVKEEGQYSVTGYTNIGDCETNSQVVNVSIIPAPDEPNINFDGTELSTDANAEEYQWFRDGNEILGATSNIYKPTEPGLYNVVIYSQNGCDASSITYEIESTSVSMIEDSKHIRVSPNPFKSKISVYIDINEITNITDIYIRDLNGNIIRHLNPKNNLSDFEIQLDNVAKGMYYLIINTKSNKFIKKIIKSN